MAFITPAKTHPDLIVQVVAARDRKKAEEFAQKNGIPEVADSYQGMHKNLVPIVDPEV